MTWDWSSPIALGIFLIMVGATVVLLCLGLAIMSSGVKVLANLPATPSARRGRR